MSSELDDDTSRHLSASRSAARGFFIHTSCGGGGLYPHTTAHCCCPYIHFTCLLRGARAARQYVPRTAHRAHAPACTSCAASTPPFFFKRRVTRRPLRRLCGRPLGRPRRRDRPRCSSLSAARAGPLDEKKNRKNALAEQAQQARATTTTGTRPAIVWQSSVRTYNRTDDDLDHNHLSLSRICSEHTTRTADALLRQHPSLR